MSSFGFGEILLDYFIKISLKYNWGSFLYHLSSLAYPLGFICDHLDFSKFFGYQLDSLWNDILYDVYIIWMKVFVSIFYFFDKISWHCIFPILNYYYVSGYIWMSMCCLIYQLFYLYFQFFQSMPDYLLVFCTANLDDRLQEKNITIKSLVQTPSNCYQVAADHIIGM